MAENRVRIRSAENVVTDAEVSLRDVDGEWRDVRHAVRAAHVDLAVGKLAVARLDLVLAEADVEGGLVEVSHEKLEATANVLRFFGFDVTAPEGFDALAGQKVHAPYQTIVPESAIAAADPSDDGHEESS